MSVMETTTKGKDCWYDDVPELEGVSKDMAFEDLLMFLRDKASISDLALKCDDRPITMTRKGRRIHPDHTKYPAFDSNGNFGANKRWLNYVEKELLPKHELAEKRYRESQECDFSVQLEDASLARLHCMRERDGFAVKIRIQSLQPPTLKDLFGKTWNSERTQTFVKNLIQMYDQKQGLIVIGGKVRSGKTCLEHAGYEAINDRAIGNGVERREIYVVADPLEFVHDARYAGFTHREIGRDAPNYSSVIQGALRVPHDIFAIGEMRGEHEVAESILRCSINGSLVVCTTHTSSMIYTMERFTTSSHDISAESMQQMFHETIVGLINLKLVIGIDGEEVLVVEYVNFAYDEPFKTSLKEPNQLKAALDARGDRARSLENDAIWLHAEGIIDEQTRDSIGSKSYREQLLTAGRS
jgi:Tfp pilus assembly pilus retraction ATPase PilT